MAEHWNGGSGGKGDKPRPFNISDEEYGANHTLAFGDKTAEKEQKAREKAEYFAKLKAETDDKLTRYNEETQQVLGVTSYTKEI
jgi:hypothetical protein